MSRVKGGCCAMVVQWCMFWSYSYSCSLLSQVVREQEYLDTEND